MANTHSFDSIVEQLLSESIPLPRPAMPAVTNYCTPIYLKGPVVAGKAVVPVVSSVQAVQENPTSFENSNDVLLKAQPTLVHLSAQFGFTSPEQNTGLDLKLTLASHLTQLEQAIQAKINAVITETNFSAAVVTVGSGSFAVGHLETLLAAVPSRSIVALDSAYQVKVKSNWMPASEEAKLKELSYISGLGEDVRGFAARPEAIALVIGYPSSGPVADVKTSFIELPIGLKVLFSRWWARGGRSWRGSLDICLAAEVGQGGAMRLLKTTSET